MTHHHVAERAAAYWANDVSDNERASIDDHLLTCEACRREFESVRVALGALASWPKEPAVPPSVAGRIVDRVRLPRAEPVVAAETGPKRKESSLPSTHRLAWRTRGRVAAVIAALACGAGGFILGRGTSASARVGTAALPAQNATTAADSTLRPFLLLLEERSWPPPQPLARPGYGEWTRAMRAQARFAGAEKLTDEPGYRLESDGRVARPEGSIRPPNVSGWYVVRARSYEEAIDWARQGPHLAYGSVLVREIER